MSKKLITRRHILAAGAALVTAGCFDNPVLENATAALKFAAFGAESQPLRRADVAKLPYASMTAKVGKGPSGFLILAYAERDDRHWFAGGGQAVVTRHGRVVKTVGLPRNLRQTTAHAADPLAGPTHQVARGTRFRREVDYEADERFVLPIESTFERIGPRKITILEIEFDTVLIRERNRARLMNWEFENLYWVDAIDGYVWKSRQHISPDFAALETEVLKPPA